MTAIPQAHNTPAEREAIHAARRKGFDAFRTPGGPGRIGLPDGTSREVRAMKSAEKETRE